MSELEPLDPATGKAMYLDARRPEVADRTIQSHHYRLKQFVKWCDSQGIENLNDVGAREIHQFRVKRRDEDGLARATMRGVMSTMVAFVRFCESIDAMEQGLSEKIILPRTTDEDVREEMVTPKEAKQILDYLQKFRYASLEHALWEVLYHTGIRLGSARAPDESDFDPNSQSLEIVHRPNQETPLKNQKGGERHVAISERVTDVLQDWLEHNHPRQVDEYDRLPLFGTHHGRVSRTHARRIVYHHTKPCVRDEECPHDRDISTCEATSHSKSYACPSSMSPHAIRRGSITYHLQEDTPKQIVRDRMDSSEKIIDRFYDQRTSSERMEQRRDYLPDDE